MEGIRFSKRHFRENREAVTVLAKRAGEVYSTDDCATGRFPKHNH